MSTWEERMAARAAVRRMIREVEAHANGLNGPRVMAGFECGAVGYTPVLPTAVGRGDMLLFIDDGKLLDYRVIGEE